jgi:DNA (cytosine-5)-methyltransferase 1
MLSDIKSNGRFNHLQIIDGLSYNTKFIGTKTNLEQMIGNAVPVNLAKFVAEGIKSYLKNGPKHELSLLDLMDVCEQIDTNFTLPQKSLEKV